MNRFESLITFYITVVLVIITLIWTYIPSIYELIKKHLEEREKHLPILKILFPMLHLVFWGGLITITFLLCFLFSGTWFIIPIICFNTIIFISITIIYIDVSFYMTCSSL